MAITFKLKASTTAAKIPTTSDLADGEVGINIPDKVIYQRSGSTVYAIANYFSGAWADISGKPTVFPPSAHTHDFTNVSAGTEGQALLPGSTTMTPITGATGAHVAVKLYSNDDNDSFAVLSSSTSDTTSEPDQIAFRVKRDGTTLIGPQQYEAWHAGNFNPASKADAATTLSGYGITDAVTINTAQSISGSKNFTGNQISVQGSSPRLVFIENGGDGKNWAALVDNNRFTLRGDTTAEIAMNVSRGAKELYWSSSTISWDGHSLWHAGNLQLDTVDTANTVAQRNGNGDIYARLFRPTFANQSTISGAIAYRVNDSTDNYIRFCSSPSAVRSWLGAVENVDGVSGIRKMTQAAYDALGTKDANTLYVIVG